MSASSLPVPERTKSFPHNLTPADVDKIRRMVLAGSSTAEIAAAFGTTERRAEVFLAVRRPRWLRYRDEGRIEFMPEKTVFYRWRSRGDGGRDLRPFSVAAISMHRAALEKRA